MDEHLRFSPRRARGHRERLNLPRAKLAEELGCTPKAIQGYEDGSITPALEKFLRMAEIFDVKLEDLCRLWPDEEAEYQAGRNWPNVSFPPPEPS